MLSNALFNGPTYNVKSNIIDGPNPGDYWNHSPGLEKPLVREEGPWPIQGNIGSLLSIPSNDALCNTQLPNISGSPNCTNVFKPDYWTQQNTCGTNCQLNYPESYGDKNFGINNNVMTNSHALHAYTNTRAAMEGSGPSDTYGCYEWIPRLTKTAGGSCVINQQPGYQQVGDWTKLQQNSDLIRYTFKN